jgi:hypothetical protein
MELLARDQREANALSSAVMVRSVSDLVRSGFLRWSPGDAARAMRETSYPGQDRHKTTPGQDHIAVLTEIMRRGLWRAHDKIDFARLPDGKIILVNGHHRLSAQEVAGREIDWVVVIHDCASMKEVAKLYHDFDTNTRLRSKNQILSVEGIAAELGISPTMANAVFGAIPVIAAGMNTSKKAKDLVTERVYDLRFDVVREYAEAARSFETCLEPAEWDLKRRILRNGSTAVALVTLRYVPRKAQAFWSLIGEDDKLAKGHPCHTFNKTIRANTLGSTAWYSAGWAAAAWNAYMRNEHPRFFSIGEPRPIKLIGTPFEKGR